MERRQEIEDWIRKQWPTKRFVMQYASGDASFRQYLRVQFENDETAILMYAPPSHEDCRPWLEVQRLLAEAGVHVPKVISTDLQQGFILMSDLGNETYLKAVKPENAADYYRAAISTLIRMQRYTATHTLPVYDQAMLGKEWDLFEQWYIPYSYRYPLTSTQNRILAHARSQTLAQNCAEPKVFVHRDFHARNLMASDPLPGILDFQDAVLGPISYDLVSLLKDAYITWPEETVQDSLLRYWQEAQIQKLPVRKKFVDFKRDFDWMGVQRHLKILGIFVRLHERDGKSNYLIELPRVMDYLLKVCADIAELHALGDLLLDASSNLPVSTITHSQQLRQQ